MNIFYNFISSDSNTIYNPNFNTGAEDCDSATFNNNLSAEIYVNIG